MRHGARDERRRRRNRWFRPVDWGRRVGVCLGGRDAQRLGSSGRLGRPAERTPQRLSRNRGRRDDAFQETILTEEIDQARLILGDGYWFAHQSRREHDGQGITTASRRPIGEVLECDLHVTPRTANFACTSLITEILAPQPLARVWVANHLPDYQLDHEVERCLQAVVAAGALERLAAERPGHVIVAGDLDADPTASSVRFWTGRQALDGLSVCYRDAWESVNAHDPGETFVPENPLSADWDWPYRRIDYVSSGAGLTAARR